MYYNYSIPFSVCVWYLYVYIYIYTQHTQAFFDCNLTYRITYEMHKNIVVFIIVVLI